MSDAAESPPAGVSQTGEAAGAAAVPARGEDLFGAVLSPHPDQVEAEPHKFGAGRPKGSRNRTTEDLARLVQQIGGHPVLAMARVAGMSVQQIKEMLGCTRAEAFDRWWRAQVDLAPYVASKQPLAVAVSGKIATLNIGVQLPGGDQALGPAAVLTMFEAARATALKEGFELPALREPVEDDDATESNT